MKFVVNFSVLMLEVDGFRTYCRFRSSDYLRLTNAASSRVRLRLMTLNIISYDYFPQHEFYTL